MFKDELTEYRYKECAEFIRNSFPGLKRTEEEIMDFIISHFYSHFYDLIQDKKRENTNEQ